MNQRYRAIDLLMSLEERYFRLIAIELAKKMPSTFVRIVESLIVESLKKEEEEPVGPLVCDILEALKAECPPTTSPKIKAIKKYREATGAGLREAKEAVERIMRKYDIP